MLIQTSVKSFEEVGHYMENNVVHIIRLYSINTIDFIYMIRLNNSLFMIEKPHIMNRIEQLFNTTKVEVKFNTNDIVRISLTLYDFNADYRLHEIKL